jgi:uncharacterized protein YcbK (DUF882 family)
MNLQEQIYRIHEMMGLDQSPFDGIDKKLVDIFNKIQSEYGKPLKIKSTKRDKKTNKSSGGARNSAHLRGKAIDIKFDSPDREGIKKLITLATKYGILGIGVYRDAEDLHLDIDETLGKRAWGPDYTINSVPSWAKKEILQHLKSK